jgi:uncharacterized protein (TIGR00369 family)
MLEPALEAAIRKRFSGAQFAEWTGIELVSLGEGESELRLALEPHHLNPGGIAHGGIVASMLDIAIGLAHRTQLGMGATHVTVELHVNYLRPARGGSTIEARGRSVRSGDRVGYGEATLLDEAGTELARASATFLVVSGTLDGE